jgi:hypothetical protein
MHAKPGKGDELFELTNKLHYNGDPDGPVDWALCRSDEEPDTLWAFKFYRDDESFTRHYSNPDFPVRMTSTDRNCPRRLD